MRDGFLDGPPSLIALQQRLQLSLLIPIFSLDVSLEDDAIVPQAHLPVRIHVVLDQLILLWVGHDLQSSDLGLQQRGLEGSFAGVADAIVGLFPFLLVFPVVFEVPGLAHHLLPLLVADFGE